MAGTNMAVLPSTQSCVGGGGGNTSGNTNGVRQQFLSLDTAQKANACIERNLGRMLEELRSLGEGADELLFHDRTDVGLATVEDLMEGLVQRMEWRRLMRKHNLTQDEAKSRVCPAIVEGSSYLEVQARLNQCPRYMAHDLGGASVNIEEPQIEFALKRAILEFLLGISSANGGGPGWMEIPSIFKQWTAVSLWGILSTQGAQSLLPKYCPVVAQVLLHLPKKEAPNGFVTKGYLVRPQKSLKARRANLYTLGAHRLVVYANPGGFGTGQESFDYLVDNQLSTSIKTMLGTSIESVFLEYRGSFRGFNDWLERMAQDRAIKRQDLDVFTTIDVEDCLALAKVASIISRGSKKLLGKDIVENWQRRTGKNLLATVSELHSRFRRTIPRFISVWCEENRLPMSTLACRLCEMYQVGMTT